MAAKGVLLASPHMVIVAEMPPFLVGADAKVFPISSATVTDNALGRGFPLCRVKE